MARVGWRPPLDDAAARRAAIGASWHEPSDAECLAAASLVDEILAKAEGLAAAVAAGSEAPTSERLRACLLELDCVARGALPYLRDEPTDDGPAAEDAAGGAAFEHPTSDSSPPLDDAAGGGGDVAMA